MPFSLLSNKWLIGGLIVAVLAGALTVQTARLKAAQKAETAAAQIATQWRTNFEAMEATNAANVRAIEKLQAEAKRIERAANVARQANAKLSQQYDQFRESLRYVEDDRAVSPVLCRTFNELRRIQNQSGLACSD
jgi:small-conductance mechanosensitive channel